MADAAILIRWDRSLPGREQQGLSLFGNALEYYGTLQSQGTIESFEPVLLNPVGTDLGGFILIRGTAEKLDALKRDDQFVDMTIRAEHLIDGFGVIDAYLGDDLQSRMVKYAQIVSQ
jgi:hypothetical protein